MELSTEWHSMFGQNSSLLGPIYFSGLHSSVWQFTIKSRLCHWAFVRQTAKNVFRNSSSWFSWSMFSTQLFHQCRRHTQVDLIFCLQYQHTNLNFTVHFRLNSVPLLFGGTEIPGLHAVCEILCDFTPLKGSRSRFLFAPLSLRVMGPTCFGAFFSIAVVSHVCRKYTFEWWR